VRAEARAARAVVERVGARLVATAVGRARCREVKVMEVVREAVAWAAAVLAMAAAGRAVAWAAAWVAQRDRGTEAD